MRRPTAGRARPRGATLSRPGPHRDDLRRLLEELDRDGTTVMDLVREGRPQVPWTLYPGEYGIFDRGRGSQFYYHAHEGTTHEAGHFHTVRLFTDYTVHLIGISVNQAGWPQALFTLNLWAIGDVWATPEQLKSYARAFRVESPKADPRLLRFINLVFGALELEIEALQDEKARAMEAYRAAHPNLNPFEDRSLEILSRAEIDLRTATGRQVSGTAVSAL